MIFSTDKNATRRMIRLITGLALLALIVYIAQDLFTWAYSDVPPGHYARKRMAMAAKLRDKLKDHPEDIKAHFDLAELTYNRSEELSEYRIVAALNSKYPHVHERIGDCLLNMKRPEEAMAEYNKMMIDGPSLESCASMRNEYTRTGKTQEAINMYLAAERKDPDTPEYPYEAGLLLVHDGRKNEARAAFKRAILTANRVGKPQPEAQSWLDGLK